MKEHTVKTQPENNYKQFSRKLLGQIKDGTVSFVRQDSRVIQINVTQK